MWYVVQTTVGSEKQIAEKLNRVYSEHAENPCFVLLKERTWRREGIYQIGVEPMFPGYILWTQKTHSVWKRMFIGWQEKPNC